MAAAIVLLIWATASLTLFGSLGWLWWTERQRDKRFEAFIRPSGIALEAWPALRKTRSDRYWITGE